MTIEEYLQKTQTTSHALATKAGVNPATLWKYLQKKQKSLSASDALRISNATGWKVTVLDILYPDEDFDFLVVKK